MPSLEDLTDEQKINLARAANQVMSNPETSREFKRLWQKANPKIKFPELEQEDRFANELKTRDEKIAQLEAQQMEEAAQRNRAIKHQEARARGLDPDEVEKLVVEKKVMDWNAAMDFTEMQHSMAASTPSSAESAMKPMTSIAELWNDPAGWARKETHKAIDDLHKRTGGGRRII
jgi:hypothetical protein